MKKVNKWLTLVELVVAITISAIILLFLMNFIAWVFNEITYSKNKTKIITQIYEASDTIKELKQKYNSWSILIDNASWTWSDILLFRTWSWETEKKWFIVAMVSNDNLKIDWSWNVDIVWDKVLAYKKLSKKELDDLEVDSNKVYDFKFNRDKLFSDIKLKDFQVEKYNSWAIFEITLFINPSYKFENNGAKYSLLWDNKIEKVVLDF